MRDACLVGRVGPHVKNCHADSGNRDYILNYRLAENDIESTALLYEHGDENFFVVMMEPPPKPSNAQILPREYIFLLDVSGSMSGFPLDTTKALMKRLLGDLGSGDYLNLVVFAGSSGVFSNKSLPATQDNVSKVIGAVDSLSGGGGTELMEGLRTAYGIKAASACPARSEGSWLVDAARAPNAGQYSLFERASTPWRLLLLPGMIDKLKKS